MIYHKYLSEKNMHKNIHLPFYRQLYFQVLLAILLGVLCGSIAPNLAIKMKVLGDGFIKLVTMIIAPIVFVTIVVGIGKMGDMRAVGRVGIKALVYFEVVSTIALLLGLVVVNVLKPGTGVNIDIEKLDHNFVANIATKSSQTSLNAQDFILNIIPSNITQAFVENNILQILFFAILFGLALSKMGKKGKNIVNILDQTSHVMFEIVNLIMKISPIGAFGAMAYTIGEYGTDMIYTLGKLMICVYFACGLFISVILGLIAKMFNFSLWSFIKHIKEEILVVFGTSSSESVLPQLMQKMETFGCKASITGMVIPTGYSFNLDGTSIYLSMAAIFLAQATGIELSIQQQLTIVGILFITSKGAAAVSGGGFIVLISTLAILDIIPSSSAAILIGIDRFMSQARAITNLLGNGVATIVVAKWENAFTSLNICTTTSKINLDCSKLNLIDQKT
jgi:aerobic C4-dicarboxylate transport protein